MKNHLCNMIAAIKNGQLVKTTYVLQTNKTICRLLLDILWNEGFILGYRTYKSDITKLQIFLKYNKKVPVIKKIKNISKPGSRMYFSAKQLWKINPSKTFPIISTSKGLKSLSACKRFNLGGELLLIIN